MAHLSSAAQTAVSDPQTWVPVVAAGLLVAADVDKDWSRDLAEDQPLFGKDAENTSDKFRDAATIAYVVTALGAPSQDVGDKARGLAVGVSTMIMDGVLTQGLKDLTGRERPDGSNDESFPSGHVSKASSRSNMAIRNLAYMDLEPWLHQTAAWTFRSIGVGAALSRVETDKHHLCDVLVGYAVGHFISTFMYEAFMADATDGASLSFVPVPEGGALKLTLPLR